MSTHSMNLQDTMDFLRAKLNDLPRGEMSEIVRNNPNLDYPTLNRFKNDKLPFVPKKLVVDCLGALGFKNIIIEETIIVSFDNQ